MDSLFLWIIVFTALGGVLSAAAAGAFLLLPEAWRSRWLSAFVSFAVGALLGAAFLDLLPEALMSRGPEQIGSMGVVVLLGLLGFFLLEKLVLWRHCHVEECEVHGAVGATNDVKVSGSHTRGGWGGQGHTHDHESVRSAAAGKLILIGDGIHNLTDGVLIAAAFLTDIQLGVVTSIAVIAHEIPQEVGDFAILLDNGYGRTKAIVLNGLSAATTLPGAMLAYFWLEDMRAAVPYILAISAASFIYIAAADLIPGLHRQVTATASLRQLVLLLAGIGTIAIFHHGG